MNESAMRHAIETKRDGGKIKPATWEAMIGAYMDGDVDDAQMASLLMACVWRGLDMEEASALTRAMVGSGATLSYPSDVFVVDKHSSGGVGDIVSLVAVPIVAACGVPVAKLSGRALGHTGGTIDKLETIDGVHTALTMDAFVAQVKRIGCAIAAQTESFVPADKRLYRLRDRTATVACIGLIAASIVSKKVAGGASAFVFDVKCGNAAFMRDPASATELGRALVEISSSFEKGARAVVTDMNEPLGRAIGDGLETIEARDLLRGEADRRARDVCVRIATEMLDVAGIDEPHAKVTSVLANGAAYEKFIQLIEAQGGHRQALEELHPSTSESNVLAQNDGYVSDIDAVAIGHAGREWSARDRGAGIIMSVRRGDKVERGQTLAVLHGHDVDTKRIANAISIGSAPVHAYPLVYATI